jgi:hypothetical protein
MNMEYDQSGPGTPVEEGSGALPLINRDKMAKDVVQLIRTNIVDKQDVKLAVNEIYKVANEYVSSFTFLLILLNRISFYKVFLDSLTDSQRHDFFEYIHPVTSCF